MQADCIIQVQTFKITSTLSILSTFLIWCLLDQDFAMKPSLKSPKVISIVYDYMRGLKL